MKIERKASWWKLNILIVTTLAILFLVITADMPPFIRKLIEISIIVSSYMLIGFWVYSNATALEAEDRER